MEGAPEIPPPSAAPRPRSARFLLERIGGILLWPRRYGRSLVADRLSWLAPLMLLAVLTWLPSQPAALREMRIAREQAQVTRLIDRGVLSAEQGEAMVERLEAQREAPWSVRAGQLAIGALSLGVLRILFPALLLWAGVRFVMEGRARYLAVVSVLAHSAVPAGIRELVRAPLQRLTQTTEIEFSPAIWTGTDTLGGYALAQLDLFDIWILAVLVGTLAAVGGIGRARAAGLVLPLWAVYTLLKLAYRATPFGMAT
ncbi:MAG: hypothetical protein GF330_00520 [Candidatus Eisenbacteria bacterium]|nr:hypothetical protein [Candidatus Eisenbacteria bacterium]